MKKSINLTNHFFIYISFLLMLSCINPDLPVVETLDISGITQTTAKSGGNILSDGRAEITAKGVCYNSSSNPSIMDNKTIDGTGDASFESSVSNLLSGTTYYLKAYTTNSVGTAYGDEKSFTTASDSSPAAGSQIIADHTIVADYDKIPANYMAEVKKMMVCFPGESHSEAYRTGMTLLEELDLDYSCNISTGEAYTDLYLRVNYGSATGERAWFTWNAYPVELQPSARNTIKNMIKEYSDMGHPIHALGFGWCWDMVAGDPSSATDPVFGCHWWGWSGGGPEGSLCWGLDETDKTVTANTVCLITYLNATEDYIAYCKENGYVTNIIFTTGPVDTYYKGEAGYQGYLKHEAIRNFVKADSTRILFDYADILCYDDDGKLTATSWNGHTFPGITPTNLGNKKIGHIGEQGAIRLAKAQWWMLARIAGWNGK